MKSFLAAIALLCGICAHSQHAVYQNLNTHNDDHAAIASLIEKYINSAIQPEEAFTQYDINTYPTIDVMKESLSLGGSLYAINFDVNILSINRQGENYLAKAMLYWHNQGNETKAITVLGIADFWIKQENGQWKISNYLNYYTQNWSNITVGNIKYVYYPEFPFDSHSAQTAVDFYNGLCTLFDITEHDNLTYYIANNCNEVSQMCGFSYFIGEGNNANLCAYYDEKNSLIFSGNSEREANLHEIIHIINRYYPTANPFMLIGLSCYINDAGSRGKDLLFHLKRFLEYAKTNNPDYENFEEFGNIDDYTNCDYVTGGIICNALYRKGGIQLVKAFLQNTEDMDTFKAKLKKELKFKDFKAFFTAEFNVYLKQKKSLLYID
ncbi:hypothetical protein AM493_19855 [Flavobacterium akiainvivens]|uniref:Uncharacterized protein n=1 Tax=Flavobacterium akiainvivens TaxID=1202724 RepID=A0A0M8MFX1_9FLAO|nr:hypothetical protein [Flavobacterium akiainvivens]KOS08054.1 hypothetical protein AM493_19855 [Flavobacterium akiainvivens]SFQ62374.1 hypothetical protein SAMN05444144_110116 [Flavobacterium akiainvivens]